MEDMETQAGPSSSSQPPHKCTHPTTAAATAATAPCDETDMQRTNTPPPHQDTNASASPAHHHHSEDNRPLHGPMGDSNKSIHIDGEGGHNPDPFPLMDLADSVFHLVLKRLQESPSEFFSWMDGFVFDFTSVLTHSRFNLHILTHMNNRRERLHFVGV